MKFLVVLLVVAAIAAPMIHGGRHHKKHHKNKHHDDDDKKDDNDDDDDHRDEEYSSLQKRLDDVTARLHNLDDELDKRFDPDLRVKALSLEYRVATLEEPNCDEHHYDCGSPDHECVSKLIICDGVKDCRNGDDEEHCSLPTNKGDHFVGHRVYENCSDSIPESFDFSITAVKVHADYPAFPRIRAVLHFAESTDEDDHEISVPTDGYYRYATHKLVLRPPQGRHLGLVCDFDGADEDRCVGDIMQEGSLNSCARFIFHRKGDDDDEEEEESKD